MTDLGRLADALDEIRMREYYNGATGATCARLSDAAAEDVPRLLAALDGVLELAGRAEHGCTRWEDPLPVPEWVTRVRDVISSAVTAPAAAEV